MSEAILRVFRGDATVGEEKEYKVPVEEGMVVLDALHYIQAEYDHDLAVRWNCKAAKCGSCSTEINGKPQLACKSRMDKFPEGQPITVYPIKAFPIIKDLVTDVSWNYEVNKKIPAAILNDDYLITNHIFLHPDAKTIFYSQQSF